MSDHPDPTAPSPRLGRGLGFAVAAVALLWAVLLRILPLGGVLGAAAVAGAALAGLALVARRSLGLRWAVGHDTWLAAVVLVVHLAVSYVAIPVAAAVVPLLGRQAEQVVFTATSDLPTVAVAALAGLLVAPLEELWWRGSLQPVLHRGRPGWLAIAMTTAAFVAFHLPTLQLPLMGAALLGGVAWGWLRERTGGLLAPMLAHAGWSAAMVLVPPG